MAVGLSWLAAPGSAHAHALMQRYDLPVPLALFLGGSAAAVALSFVVLGWFAHANAAGPAPAVRLDRSWVGRAAGSRITRGAAGMASVAVLVLLVAAGLFGNQDPFRNIAPVTVWVVWWVGFAYIAALVGNIWPLVNPWAALHRAGVALFTGGRARPLLRYPEGLGAWPAVALLLAFAWLELVWPMRDQPRALACAVLVYSVITLAGMTLFGRRLWLERCEAFALVFDVLGRFAPFGLGRGSRCTLRPPAAALIDSRPASPSGAAFVILLLSTVTFDGLLETPLWVGIAETALAGPTLPALAGALGADPYVLLVTAGLIGFALMFMAAFVLVCWLMAAAVGGASAPSRVSAGDMARNFVWSLVPIAIAYHLAHYLAYFLVAGQFIIPLVSDPFGVGWNLFGTKLYFIDIGIVDARFVWYTSVAAIVTGHVIAVYIAHVQALRRFASARLARRSQYPMVALMIAYTAISLWILAQPITEPATG